MIGIASPKNHTNRPERGHLKKPLRCTDDGCPSRANCRRPGNPGEPHNFKHNRGNSATCAYYMHKETD